MGKHGHCGNKPKAIYYVCTYVQSYVTNHTHVKTNTVLYNIQQCINKYVRTYSTIQHKYIRKQICKVLYIVDDRKNFT